MSTSSQEHKSTAFNGSPANIATLSTQEYQPGHVDYINQVINGTTEVLDMKQVREDRRVKDEAMANLQKKHRQTCERTRDERITAAKIKFMKSTEPLIHPFLIIRNQEIAEAEAAHAIALASFVKAREDVKTLDRQNTNIQLGQLQVSPATRKRHRRVASRAIEEGRNVPAYAEAEAQAMQRNVRRRRRSNAQEERNNVQDDNESLGIRQMQLGYPEQQEVKGHAVPLNGQLVANGSHPPAAVPVPVSNGRPNEEAQSCPICMEFIKVDSGIRSISCTHELHPSCLDGLIVDALKSNREEAKCPMCRAVFWRT